MRFNMQLSFLFVLIAAVSGCSFVTPNLARSGAIEFDEPIMSKSIDEHGNPVMPTTVFRATDDRIYCTIVIRGPDNVRLGARWYYGDKMFYDHVIDFGTQRRASWWIERKTGGKISVGDYRVEIYLLTDPVRTVRFQVIE